MTVAGFCVEGIEYIVASVEGLCHTCMPQGASA